jgi:hypothetical protein
MVKEAESFCLKTLRGLDRAAGGAFRGYLLGQMVRDRMWKGTAVIRVSCGVSRVPSNSLTVVTWRGV